MVLFLHSKLLVLLLRLMQDDDRYVLTVQKVSLKLKRSCKGKTGCSEMRVLVHGTLTCHRSSHSRSSESHQSLDRSSLSPLAICRNFSANNNQNVMGKCRMCPKPKVQLNIESHNRTIES